MRELPLGANGAPLQAVWPGAGWLLTPLNYRAAVIYDTDFLLNSVTASVLHDREPTWTLPSGYASQHVFDELYRPDAYGHRHKWDKLSEQAAEAGRTIPSTQFQEMFETEYLPRIRFVEMGDQFADQPIALRVRDTHGGRGKSDVPTAQLAVLLSRVGVVVFSHDKHLRGPGLAPSASHLVAAADAEHNVVDGEHAQAGLAGATVLSVWGVDRGLRAVGAAVGANPWLVRGVALGGLIALFWDPARREAFGRSARPLVDGLADLYANVSANLAVVREHVVNVPASESIEARVAEAFVRGSARGPMLAGELHAILVSDGDVDDPPPSVGDLRTVLGRSPSFVEGPRWRFSLGHCYEQTV
jgi:hypothetical protein